MSALINRVDIMKPRILIVDNEIDTQKQLKHLLELANFSVKCIQDGSDAINYILETIPDVILFDVVLPTMDGLELFRIMLGIIGLDIFLPSSFRASLRGRSNCCFRVRC